MCKEEKIKDILEILELAKSDLIEENKNVTAILDYDDLVSLQCLLGLYEQEKEKNKELQEEIENWKFTAKYVENNYTDKTKIREKIRMYKLVGNSVSARVLELLLKEN